jgi:hypothetical protein
MQLSTVVDERCSAGVAEEWISGRAGLSSDLSVGAREELVVARRLKGKGEEENVSDQRTESESQ